MAAADAVGETAVKDFSLFGALEQASGNEAVGVFQRFTRKKGNRVGSNCLIPEFNERCLHAGT